MKGHLEPTDAARKAIDRFVQRRESLADSFEAGELAGGRTMAHALTDAADDWLRELWEEAREPSLDVSILALGGYGRRELAWGSDLDVVIEVDAGAVTQPILRESVERFMAWARLARVKLAHAVRTPDQTVVAFAQDYRTAVSYLDARPLLSQPRVGAEVAAETLRDEDDGVGFVQMLFEDYRRRLARFGRTIYLLEPDVKSGKGALRDLHMIRWSARVSAGIDAAEQSDEAFGWTSRDLAAYRDGEEWLLEVRELLHAFRRRKHDRLHFEDQERLAAVLMPGRDEVARATEALMRRHYQTTRTIARLTERSLRRWASAGGHIECEIDDVFRVGGGQLTIAADVELDATTVFEALRLASEYDVLLEPSSEDRLEAAVAAWGTDVRLDPHNGRVLRGLLVDPDTSARTSTRLLELGILHAIVPEFEPVVCHVQHDVYHVYTTDVHLVHCLEFARALLTGGDAARSRWTAFAAIADEVEDRTVFLLAALFHDIGKNRGGGHSERGAAMMLDVGPRLGLDESQTELLSFLVREHLTLSHVARRHDISDRRLVRDLAARIRTVQALNQLTALTFCDSSTVGENVMTDWSATLLLQLYQRLRATIEHGVEEAWRQIEADVQEIRAWLTDHVDADRSRLDAFVRDMPATFLVESSRGALGRVFEAWERGGAGEPFVTTSADPDRGSTELIVSAGDIPGALARITGTISSLGLNILDARIVTTASGRLLDVFHVAQSGGASHAMTPAEQRAVTDEVRLNRLCERLLAVLRGEASVEELLRRRIAEKRLAPRPTPDVDTVIEELDDVSDDYTVLQISAPDRIGLLYEIARTLSEHDVDIRLSKIDSVGTQVVDTFYLETFDGAKLAPETVAAIRGSLHDVIEQSTLRD